MGKGKEKTVGKKKSWEQLDRLPKQIKSRGKRSSSLAEPSFVSEPGKEGRGNVQEGREGEEPGAPKRTRETYGQ